LRNWTNALADANTLSDGACGLTDGSVDGDWRLPNIRELQSLIDYQSIAPSLPTGHPFSGVQEDYYWSSTTDVIGPDHAWIVNLIDGHGDFGSKNGTTYVWPVRGGQ
jgi:hypothetical protein